MACLTADHGYLPNDVAMSADGITHALARAASASQTAHHLCAFDKDGVLRNGTYWTSRVAEADIMSSRKPHGLVSLAIHESQRRG